MKQIGTHTNSQRSIDEFYMARCIQLAQNGRQNAQPNPMVGAVIVAPTDGDSSASEPSGRIIGEGYHIRCGEGHAEVNACASVRPEDEHLLLQSTIYVSLEPCSHWGKTPPCAELLVSKGFRRCVIGCQDPFAKVQGRGIQRLRDAGIEVTVGVLEEECKALNKVFMTFHGKQRPYVTLKWAQSADGFIDGHISNAITQAVCHKRRAEHQAIMVGKRTEAIDNPKLNVREWYGPDPRKYVAWDTVPAMLAQLHADGIQSLLVEGGAQLHKSFIDSGLWDEAFVETGTKAIDGKVPAPTLQNAVLENSQHIMGHTMNQYINNIQAHK